MYFSIFTNPKLLDNYALIFLASGNSSWKSNKKFYIGKSLFSWNVINLFVVENTMKFKKHILAFWDDQDKEVYNMLKDSNILPSLSLSWSSQNQIKKYILFDFRFHVFSLINKISINMRKYIRRISTFITCQCVSHFFLQTLVIKFLLHFQHNVFSTFIAWDW